MISRWRKLLSMTGEEFRVRVRQNLNMRSDCVLSWMGFRHPPRMLKSQPVATGSFFFSESALPDRIGLLRKYLPCQLEDILGQAEEICHHRFRLLGYGAVDYGAEIDWHLDAVNSKKAPLRSWYKVPFLDFSVVGDHKVTWELNRHRHFVTLAKGWLISGDDRYVNELVQQWYAWQASNPYPLGINWASALEVAFRSLSWVWAYFLLAGCTALPRSFRQDILTALAGNGHHIERYLSTCFSPNTHLIGEAAALFSLGTLFPHFSDAGRWKRLGWELLLQQAERQVYDDGMHFEQSLCYHVYALDFFLHARILAACNGIESVAKLDEILRKMLSALRLLCQAGPPQTFGDDDGGRLFDPTRNRAGHMSDPLVVGGILFDRDDFAGTAPILTEEAIWLLGPGACAMMEKRRDLPPVKTDCLPCAGTYVMVDPETNRSQMVIDAGGLGHGRAGHGHADALSVTFSHAGRHCLVDAGTCSYTSGGNERNRFRGTRAHNTVMVDGVDQAVEDGVFAWKHLPEVAMELWLRGEEFSLFGGCQTGYSRLPDPVLHHRSVFHLHREFWFVHDVLSGRERHQLEVNWHFAPDLLIENLGNSFLASPPASTREEELHLALVVAQDSVWKHSLEWDEVSPAYGRKQVAQVARLSAELALPVECGAVITAARHRQKDLGTLSVLRGINLRGQKASGYRYAIDETEHCIFFSPGQGAWQIGEWASDAQFLYGTIRDGALTHSILCGGSYALFAGQEIVNCAQRIEQFEWRNEQCELRSALSALPVRS